MQRLRIRFGRGEAVKFISHLDIMRLWERALRRARVRLAYSEGFNPHPRISLAAPLAVGITSEAELMDVFIDGLVSPHWFTGAVGQQLPDGIDINSVFQIGLNIPSLQSQVRFAEYRLEVETEREAAEVEQGISSLLEKETLPWHHHRDTGKRHYDLRTLVSQVRLAGCAPSSCTLEMKLRCDSGGSGRPEQVALALGFESHPSFIHRTGLVLQAPV